MDEAAFALPSFPAHLASLSAHPWRSSDRQHVARLDRAELWSTLANLIGHEIRGEMAIVLLDHSGVSVAKILRNQHQVHSCLYAEARPSVAQSVKTDRRRDAPALAGFAHRRPLMRFAPRLPVGLAQHDLVASTARRELREELLTLIGQLNVAGLAGLALSDRKGPRIKVGHR